MILDEKIWDFWITEKVSLLESSTLEFLLLSILSIELILFLDVCNPGDYLKQALKTSVCAGMCVSHFLSSNEQTLQS